MNIEEIKQMIFEIEQVAAMAMEFAPTPYAGKFAELADRAHLALIAMGEQGECWLNDDGSDPVAAELYMDDRGDNW